jgi:mannose-6-phosphate isomerase
MFQLTGKVQHYPWGGNSFIPELLGISNDENLPFAEYWMGIHPSAPSIIQLSKNAFTGLPDLIKSEPARYLGKDLMKTFGDLPFLFKILDVKDMLSIQVHPSKAEAEKGFDAEEAAKIPMNAPNRNYKDRNHKPEIMLALSDFWLLHGFKTANLLLETLSYYEVFNKLILVFEQSGYKGLYQFVMEMPQEEVNVLLQPLADKVIPFYNAGEIPKSSPDFWAARAFLTYPEVLDRGIFSVYFFNLVNLKPGEAIFQGAGVPHAYLEGQNVELMANSDNVLRGGLTPKHVDVPELLKHTLFEPIQPNILKLNADAKETVFESPVPDFCLSHVLLSANEYIQCEANGPEIWFILSGNGITTDNNAIHLKAGASFFIATGEKITVKTDSGIQWVKASVPSNPHYEEKQLS